LNAFLAAALLRVVRDTVPFKLLLLFLWFLLLLFVALLLVSDCLNAGGAGRVVTNAAACQVMLIVVRPLRALLRVELLSFRLHTPSRLALY